MYRVVSLGRIILTTDDVDLAHATADKYPHGTVVLVAPKG